LSGGYLAGVADGLISTVVGGEDEVVAVALTDTNLIHTSKEQSHVSIISKEQHSISLK
jgi:hypothetical protein